MLERYPGARLRRLRRVKGDRSFYSDGSGALTFLDQFPKLLGLREGIVVANRELRSEEEILERVGTEHPVHHDRLVIIGDLEVDADFAGAVAVKSFPVAIDLAERRISVVVFDAVQVVRADLEFTQHRELFQCGQLGNLGSTEFVEDDLEHVVTVPPPPFRDNEKVAAFFRQKAKGGSRSRLTVEFI